MVKSLSPESRSAFRWECFRSAGSGAIESAGMTILLLVAVRVFHLGEGSKSLVSTAGSCGLLLSPLVVYWVQHRVMPVKSAAAMIAFTGSILFLMMAILDAPLVFAVLSVAALTCSSAKIPLISSFHQHFFPASQRGSLFSWIMMIRIVSVAVVTWGCGSLLGMNSGFWRWIVLFFSLCFALIGLCYTKYPVHRLSQNDIHTPWSGFHWLKSDRLFFWTLVSWMVMGFGNLMMLPLRIEYLSDGESGVWMEADRVALLTAVIPGVSRLVCVPFWGRIFDRISLFRLRIGLNFFFALHVFLFFNMKDFWGLALASAVFGVAHAGGDVAWNLWVTRLAPDGRAADYMAVHTFMTGLRGFMAPFAGFWLLGFTSYQNLAWFGGSLMILAGLFILRPAINQLDLQRLASRL